MEIEFHGTAANPRLVVKPTPKTTYSITRDLADIQWVVRVRYGKTSRALAYIVNESYMEEVIRRPSLGIPAKAADKMLKEWRKTMAERRAEE